MKRKLLCLLLCISMILPNVPMAVHADEAATCEHMEVSEGGTVSGNGVCEICAADEKVDTEEKEETDQKEDGNVQSEEKKDSEQSENEKIVSIENEDAGKSDTQETKKQQDSENGQTSQENTKQVSGNDSEESSKVLKSKEQNRDIEDSNNNISNNSISKNELQNTNDPQDAGQKKEPEALTDGIVQNGLGSIYDVVPRRMGFFALRPGNTWDSDSNTYYGQLDDDSKAVYNTLKAAYVDGAKYDSVSISFGKVISATGEKPGKEVPTEVSSTVGEEVKNIVSYALLALIYDEPEMSWLVNVTMNYGWGYDYSTTDNTNYIYTAKDFVVTVSNGGNTQYTRVQLAEEISKAKSSIGNPSNNYQTIKAIHDYICTNVDYVPEGTNLLDDKYQTVHSALIDGKTVCAGYAKAFKILCDEYGIPCILVSGTGTNDKGIPEDHMWNYVKLGGNWYAVDCTWDDQADKIYEDFFLVGGNTVAKNFDNKAFGESHVASGRWTTAMASPGFTYPTLSAEAYAQSSDATALDTVYVKSDGDDNNIGGIDNPVKSLEKALEKVKEGGTIIIQDSTTIIRDDGGVDGVFNIPKSVMIQGGEIVNERGGIVLGGDVTFKNTKIALNNSVRNAIIANGHTLVLESVQSRGTNDMHLFCGIITEPQTTYPQAGSEGKVVVKGSNTKIGNIYAGNFSDLGAYRLNGALTGNETKESHFTGNSTIIIDNTAVGTFGEIYAYGARENREGGFPNAMWTDSNDEGILNIEDMFTVNGKVIIQLHGRQITKISGASDKKAHVVFNSDTLIEGLVFSRIGTLEVNGQLQPSHFDDGLNIVLNSGGKLDLTKFSFGIPTIGNFTGAKTKETAGVLLIDENYNETPNIPDTMTVSGIIQGYTELRTNYPSSDTTSGVVTEGHAYVIGTSTNFGEEFIFKPYETQTAISLKYENGTWTAKKSGEETVHKPTSFSFGKKSESITKTKINESGISIPIEYKFDDPSAVIAGVPLKIKVTYGSQFANATMKTDDIYDGYVVNACNMEIYISGEGNLCIVNNGKNINASSNPYKIEVSVETKNGLIIETFTLTVIDDIQNSVPEAIFNPLDTNDKGWYAGLTLHAPTEDYKISKTEHGTYGEEIEIEDGEYSTYEYWLKDTQGNTSKKTITNLKVDGTSPVITKVEVSEVKTNTAKVIVEATDNLSGLNGQSYSLYLSNGLSDSGVTVGNFVGNASGGSFAISGMRVDQTYTFELAVEDNAGSGAIKSNIEITPGKTNISTGQLKLKSGISYIYGENGNGGYDWKPKSGQLLLSLNGQTISLDDTNFEYTYRNNVNAGDSAQVTVTVKDSHGTYAGSVTGTFTIGKRPITITPKQQTIRNGHQIHTGIDQVQVTNLVSGHGIGSIILSQDNTNKVITASSAVVMDNNGGEVTQNYAITYKSGSLTILNPKITIIPSSNIVYDGNAIIIGTSGTQNDVTYQLKECESPTVTWYNTTASGGKGEKLQEAPKDAGTYIVSVSAEVINQLGTISEEKQVTIKKVPLTATIGNQSIVYGGSFAVSSGKVTYTGFVNNESQSVVSGTPVYSTNYRTFGNVGTYSINADMNNISAQNYEITTVRPGTLTVTELPITVAWNNHTDRTYDDGKKVTATITNLVNNDQVTVTVSGGNATEVGTHTAKLTGLSGTKAGNYTIREVDNTQNYTITKAAAPTNVLAKRNVKWSQDGSQSLSISDFTLPANIKNPQITAVKKNNKTVDNEGIFSGNQTVANNKVTIPLTKSMSYQEGQKGVFDVTITSTTHEDITAEIIIFIVDRDVADQKITISISDVTYGQVPAPKGSFSGTKGNNPIEEYKYSKDGINFESLDTLKNTSGFLPAGDYSVQYSYTDDEQIGTKTAAFRVEKKELKISFDIEAVTKEYDGTTSVPSDKLPTLIIKKAVGSEQPKLVNTGVQFTYDSIQAGEGKTIQVTGLSLDTSESVNDNYTVQSTVSSVGAIITPKKATVLPKTVYTKQYGEKDPVLEHKVTGLIGQDTLEGVLKRAAGENVGSYSYDISGLKNQNYKVELDASSSKFDITKAEAQLTLEADLAAQKAGGKVTLTASAKSKKELEVSGAAQPTAAELTGVSFTEKEAGVFEGIYTIPENAKVGDKITVTVSLKDANYEEVTAKTVIQVIEEELQALPVPQEKPEAEGDKKPSYKLAMENGISKVPEGLKALEHLDTVEEIKDALKVEIKKLHGEITDATSAVYDVALWYHPGDDDSVWQKADKTHWPKSGKITVVLPYPEGTGKNTHNFNVTHMFTVEMNNNKPGTFEYPTVEKTDEGISFQVSGLSPITLGWTKIQEAPAPNPGSGNSTGGSSDSSEDSSSATTTTVIKRQDVKKEEAKATDTTAVAVAQEPAKQKNTKVTVKKEEKEVADNNVVSEKSEATQQTEDAVKEITEEVQEIEGIEEVSKVPQDTTQKVQEETKSSSVLWIAAIVALAAAGVVFFILWKNKKNEEA